MSDLERIKPTLHTYLPKEGTNVFKAGFQRFVLLAKGILEHAKETYAFMSSKKTEATKYQEGSSSTTEKTRAVSTYIFKLVFSSKTFEQAERERLASESTVLKTATRNYGSADAKPETRPQALSDASSTGEPQNLTLKPRPRADTTATEPKDVLETPKEEKRSRSISSESEPRDVEASPRESKGSPSLTSKFLSFFGLQSSEIDTSLEKEKKIITTIFSSLPLLDGQKKSFEIPLSEVVSFPFKNQCSTILKESEKDAIKSINELYQNYLSAYQLLKKAEGGETVDETAILAAKQKIAELTTNQPLIKKIHALNEYLNACELQPQLERLSLRSLDSAPISNSSKEYFENELINLIWTQVARDISGRQNVTITYGDTVLFSPETIQSSGKTKEEFESNQLIQRPLLNALVAFLMEKNPELSKKEAMCKILECLYTQSQAHDGMSISRFFPDAQTKFHEKKGELGLSDDAMLIKYFNSDIEKVIPDKIHVDLSTGRITKEGPRLSSVMLSSHNALLEFPHTIKYEVLNSEGTQITSITSSTIKESEARQTFL